MAQSLLQQEFELYGITDEDLRLKSGKNLMTSIKRRRGRLPDRVLKFRGEILPLAKPFAENLYPLFGVYFLIHRTDWLDEISYVGMSANGIGARIVSHQKLGRIEFTHTAVARCAPRQAGKLEFRYINWLQPLYNAKKRNYGEMYSPRLLDHCPSHEFV